MSKLRDAFPHYADLPENIRWITDRLEQMQAIDAMEGGMKSAAWAQVEAEYKVLFGGDLVTDLQRFGEEYL